MKPEPQLTLPLHRNDPPAAKLAASSARERAGSTRARIVAHLKDEQSHGGTFREIAHALHMDPAESNRRCSDLHRDGLIVRLALMRRSERSALAHVYVDKAWVLGREMV